MHAQGSATHANSHTGRPSPDTARRLDSIGPLPSVALHGVARDGLHSADAIGGCTFLYAFLFILALTSPVGAVTVTRIATGLNRPVDAKSPPGDTDRLFIVQHHNLTNPVNVGSASIKILDLNTGVVDPTPFLTIDNLNVNPNDAGLFSLEFHPDYANNGYFYVNLIPSGGSLRSETRRYQAIANPDFASASLADPNSADVILSLPEINTSHNTNWAAFGPDDMFYVSTGDGACCNDPENAGQNINTLKGKILRIDVNGDDFPEDSRRDYAIPADNPFVGQDGADEIWAYGLRNAWRVSFDRLTGDLYLGDVGQNAVEEIDVIPAGQKGLNFGWLPREGTIATPNAGGPIPPGAVDPIYDYTHGSGSAQGFSVTGGYVYRGPIAELQGHYFFADFINPRIWSLQWDRSDPSTFDGTNFTNFIDRTSELTPDQGQYNFISSFAEDNDGNLYILDLLGDVFKIGPGLPQRTWAADAAGDWNGLNWAGGGAPNANNEIAIFGGAITSTRTVFTDTAVTVKAIEFNNTAAYFVAGLGSVNLEADEGNARIDVLAGNHRFQAAVNLQSETDVDVAAGASLLFNNALDLGDHDLNQQGEGTIIFNNVVTMGLGMLNLWEGSASGSGVVAGTLVNNGGTVSPGNSPGVLGITRDYIQAEEGTLLIEIGGTVAGDQHDALLVGGTLQLAGQLLVQLTEDYQPDSNATFDILRFSALEGAFDQLSLPALEGGLEWDTTALYTSGRLAAVAIPEPETGVLAVLTSLVVAGFVRIQPRRRARTQVHKYPRNQGTKEPSALVCEDASGPQTTDHGPQTTDCSRVAIVVALLLALVTPSAAQLPITNSLMIHLDASDVVAGAEPSDGAAVTLWQDQSNNGNDAVENGNPPTYRANAINGNFPAVVFNETGSFDSLVAPDHPTLDIGTNSFTAFVVAGVGPNATNDWEVFWEKRQPGLAGHTFFHEFRNSNQLLDGFAGMTLSGQVNDGGVRGMNSPPDGTGDPPHPNPLMPQFNDGTVRMYTMMFDRINDGDGTGSFFGINAPASLLGVADDLVTDIPLGNSQSSADLTIGFSPIQNRGIDNGVFGDIILYNRELSIGEQDQTLDYLREKYNFGGPGEWLSDVAGDWNSAANWGNGAVPNSNSDVATFGDVISQPRTVFTDAGVTVAEIRFRSPISYGIAGGGSLKMDVESGNASIETEAGSHQFQVLVHLSDSTDVDVAGGAELTFNGPLLLRNRTLTKTGNGRLLINNQLNSGSGSIVVDAGVLGGHGEVGGNVINNAILSPGSSAAGVASGVTDAAVPEPSAGLLLLGATALLALRRGAVRCG